MINQKPVLICGYSRGGTNILWNILQSHPSICSPRHETGAIFRKKEHLRFSRVIRIAKRLGISHRKIILRWIDYQLYRYKMENLNSENNKYKSEGIVYTKKEVSKSFLCLKSVDNDIIHTDLLLKTYPDLFIIFMIRNGYSIANGHSRRGISIEESARNYVRVGKEMDRLMNKTPNHMLVRFENVIENPFGISEEIYRKLRLDTVTIEKLRLKSKKVIMKNHHHETLFGEENKKYWFDRDSIGHILDKDVNQRQIHSLSSDMIRQFNKHAGQQLIKFGYPLLNGTM